jgi:hypothetical protein
MHLITDIVPVMVVSDRAEVILTYWTLFVMLRRFSSRYPFQSPFPASAILFLATSH